MPVYGTEIKFDQVTVALRLDPSTDELTFQYATDWPAQPDAFQLSPAIRFEQAAAPVTVRVYNAEERVFVKQLADYITARANVLEACAKDIPKYQSREFGRFVWKKATPTS